MRHEKEGRKADSKWELGGRYGPGQWASRDDVMSVEECAEECERDSNCMAYSGYARDCNYLKISTGQPLYQADKPLIQWKKVATVNQIVKPPE